MLNKKNRKSVEIYNFFKNKYGFGELGLFEAIVACSTRCSNTKYALPSIIISPAGEAKSDVLKDVIEFFPELIYMKKGTLSEYWIAKELQPETLCHKIFAINDLADSLKSMQSRRIAGMMSFFKNLIDGDAELSNAVTDIKFATEKTGLIINIPKQAMTQGITGSLITSTFFDRVIPFQFHTRWEEEWEDLYLQKKLHNSKIKHTKKISIKEIKFDWSFEKRIVENAKYLMKLKDSGLPRNIHLVKSFLAGSAILNNRNYITISDLEDFEHMKNERFIRW